MRLSCEHLPNVCQSYAAHQSPHPAASANTEATIWKGDGRSYTWQLARQHPGSDSSRALATCFDPKTGRGVLANDLALDDRIRLYQVFFKRNHPEIPHANYDNASTRESAE
jgi:hypothetical protein